MNKEDKDFDYKSIDYRDESYAVKDITKAQKERKERRDRDVERTNIRKEHRRRVNRNRRLVLAASVVAIFALLALVGNNLFELWKLNQEKLAKEEELQTLTNQQAALTEELEQVNTDEYIEQQARSELHMIRPGETLYVFEDKN